MKPLALLALVGCRLVTAPCAQFETRYVAVVDRWDVVCLAPTTEGVQLCAVWPTPPPAPEWVGSPAVQADSGYPLRPVIVCAGTRITDTPL